MKKIEAFWDSSALVPLCVDRGVSGLAKAAMKARSLAVWWVTPVEMTSAFTRLFRNGEIRPGDLRMALARLAELRRQWIEVQPAEAVRIMAENLVGRHALRAADAMQLAAALAWSNERPRGHAFVCFDGRLAAAAGREGFVVETAS